MGKSDWDNLRSEKSDWDNLGYFLMVCQETFKVDHIPLDLILQRLRQRSSVPGGRVDLGRLRSSHLPSQGGNLTHLMNLMRGRAKRTSNTQKEQLARFCKLLVSPKKIQSVKVTKFGRRQSPTTSVALI